MQPHKLSDLVQESILKCMSNYIGLWKEFKEHRKEMKAPMSIRAEKINLNTLKKLIGLGHDQAEVINQTIANGWKGLFEIRKKKQGGGGFDPNWRDKISTTQ